LAISPSLNHDDPFIGIAYTLMSAMRNAIPPSSSLLKKTGAWLIWAARSTAPHVRRAQINSMRFAAHHCLKTRFSIRLITKNLDPLLFQAANPQEKEETHYCTSMRP
jgi:hypothetical protein